jgi:hypothetical protein
MILASSSAWAAPARPLSPATARSRSRNAIERLLQRRREQLWAWLSLVALIVCWDASLRLDEHVPIPRPRLQHAGEAVERDDRDGVMTVMEIAK